MSVSVPTRVSRRAHVRFWGTRGTCPSPGPRTVRYGGHTPCLDIRAADGTQLILDAGSGIRPLGQWLMGDATDAGPLHLVLTHRHADHVLGLPHFAPLYAGTRPVRVTCGDGDTASLPAFLSTLLSPPLFPAVAGMGRTMRVEAWPDAGSLPCGSLQVERFAARHPGEAALLRIDDAAGALLAYAPDNELAYADDSEPTRAWRSRLSEFLRGVPVLVHDATYTAAELPRHVGWGHSSSEECVRLAMACEAQTLVLFHHHPDRDDDAIERMVDGAREQAVRAGSRLQVMAAWEGLGVGVSVGVSVEANRLLLNRTG